MAILLWLEHIHVYCIVIWWFCISDQTRNILKRVEVNCVNCCLLIANPKHFLFFRGQMEGCAAGVPGSMYVTRRNRG